MLISPQAMVTNVIYLDCNKTKVTFPKKSIKNICLPGIDS